MGRGRAGGSQHGAGPVPCPAVRRPVAALIPPPAAHKARPGPAPLVPPRPLSEPPCLSPRPSPSRRTPQSLTPLPPAPPPRRPPIRNQAELSAAPVRAPPDWRMDAAESDATTKRQLEAIRRLNQLQVGLRLLLVARALQNKRAAGVAGVACAVWGWGCVWCTRRVVQVVCATRHPGTPPANPASPPPAGPGAPGV